MTFITHSTVQTWFVVLASLLVTASCQSDSENSPVPQAASVQIGNQKYPTQLIANQLWTTVNYSGPGGLAYGAGSEKAEYGRYYTFNEVKTITLPAGWRIPTMQDYVTLAQSQGIVVENNRATRQEAIKKLLAKTNWRTTVGSNTSGFNAYPTGYSFQNAQPQDGDLAEFWLADGQTVSIQEVTGQTHNLLFYSNSNDPLYRFTLRFVKNQ